MLLNTHHQSVHLTNMLDYLPFYLNLEYSALQSMLSFPESSQDRRTKERERYPVGD